MASIGVGRLVNVGGSLMIRVPAGLAKDEAFRFSEGMEVVIKIEGSNLLVWKA